MSQWGIVLSEGKFMSLCLLARFKYEIWAGDKGQTFKILITLKCNKVSLIYCKWIFRKLKHTTHSEGIMGYLLNITNNYMSDLSWALHRLSLNGQEQLKHSSNYILLYSTGKKKHMTEVIQAWSNMRENKLFQIFIFY